MGAGEGDGIKVGRRMGGGKECLKPEGKRGARNPKGREKWSGVGWGALCLLVGRRRLATLVQSSLGGG